MEDDIMRSYNFKKESKQKEQMRRQMLWGTGHWPTAPTKKTSKSGNDYFIEGSKSPYKKHLKRLASKSIRKKDLDSVGSGKHYKKVFNLANQWY